MNVTQAQQPAMVPMETPFRRGGIQKIIAITALILSATCLAQSEDVAGDWQGVLNAGTTQLRIILHITNSDGNLKATMDSVDQAAFGLPVSSISLKNLELKFEVDKVGGSYVGKLNPDATKISGSWSQNGSFFDVDFNRANAEVKGQTMPASPSDQAKKSEPAPPSDIDGTWMGTLDAGGVRLRVVFHILNTATGLTATVDSPDQGVTGVQARAVTREGSSLKIDVRQMRGGAYEGKIGSDLATIDGAYTWTGGGLPLVLMRVKDIADVAVKADWSSPSRISLSQDNISRMDQVVHGYTDSKLFMGSVLVAQDGKILLSKGYGFADMEWDVPNSPTTKFRLGSLTKQFTAVCILLLEERGKLKLDDPVKKYIADAPEAWDKITIFNLLTHTSGISNYTGFYDYESTETIATTPEKLVARFRDKPLEFQPGEEWKYSNSGYVLLGYLIEKISQQSYSQFVQENIFNPLGMKDSGYDSSWAVIPHRASGYEPSGKGVINAGYIDMSVPFAAGGLYSTTEDLMRWEQGLMGGKLLSPASLQKMTTPFKSNYALGVGVNTVNGHKVISHSGSIEGFHTELEYYPEDKLTVVVLANLNGQAPEGIARKLAAVAHGENVPLPTATKEITVSPALLESYIGVYELMPSFKIVVTLEDGELMMRATGQPKVPLFAESETKFFLKVVDAQVEFFKNEKGEVTHLMLHQNGRYIKGINISHLSAADYALQGLDHYIKGDYDQAVQGFNEAIRLDPKTPRALLYGGVANLYAGHFSDAQQDLSQNLRLDATDPYAMIWLYLSRVRSGTDGKDELKTNAAGLDLSKWPGPVIRLYLGQSTPEDTLHAAGSDIDQKCEYDFYVGEYRILGGDRPQARILFRGAANGCPKDFVEYGPALMELKDIEKQK